MSFIIYLRAENQLVWLEKVHLNKIHLNYLVSKLLIIFTKN